jgi:hypothetical protein
MTQLKKKNNFCSEFFNRIWNGPYLKINIILAGVILLVLAYSGFFSPDRDNYPVTCIHEKITGLPCLSCGLSHSFSLIVRGRIQEAYQWNIYGMRVFLFFVSQLIMRVTFSVCYMRNTGSRQWLIYYDIAGSILIFTISFYPFIRQLFMVMF